MTTIPNHSDPHSTPVTLDHIVHSLLSINVEAMTAQPLPTTPAALWAFVLTVYRGLRPSLLALAAVPLIPVIVRNGVQLFVASFDALAATNPDFKAGKDV
jgi:hypothetical protein